ncbi:DNA topoisomerase III [mine drainage metagenome]|uniref:DNA topoisomerase III n=1 Tax=mine drainage metagenome TaxID=410659 RepID=T1CAM2_9ZZZZ
MRVLVAEKPKVGRELAGVLGVVKSAEGYIECRNDTCVTWCRGHLLGQARPEAYVSGERVEARDLPIIPQRWKLAARDGDARKQLGIIKGLLARADEVIHAGDADREGQLLVDQVLYALRWSGRTQRLWLSSLDEKSIRKALSTLRPNAEYRSLFDAALGRQRADWLIGFNASIAYSRNLQSRRCRRRLVHRPRADPDARADRRSGAGDRTVHLEAALHGADRPRDLAQ